MNCSKSKRRSFCRLIWPEVILISSETEYILVFYVAIFFIQNLGLHEISHDVKAAENLPPITTKRFWNQFEGLLRSVKATNACSDEISQILEEIFDALAAKNEDKMKILRQTSVVPCLVDIVVQNNPWHIRKWLLEVLNRLIRYVIVFLCIKMSLLNLMSLFLNSLRIPIEIRVGLRQKNESLFQRIAGLLLTIGDFEVQIISKL